MSSTDRRARGCCRPMSPAAVADRPRNSGSSASSSPRSRCSSLGEGVYKGVEEGRRRRRLRLRTGSPSGSARCCFALRCAGRRLRLCPLPRLSASGPASPSTSDLGGRGGGDNLDALPRRADRQVGLGHAAAAPLLLAALLLLDALNLELPCLVLRALGGALANLELRRRRGPRGMLRENGYSSSGGAAARRRGQRAGRLWRSLRP